MAQRGSLYTFLLAGFWIVSLILPFLEGPGEYPLSGYMSMIFHAGHFIIVESIFEYLFVVFVLLANVLVIVQLFWSVRKELKKMPLFLLIGANVTSALCWLFIYEVDFLLWGYWYWLVTILAVSTYNIRKLKRL